VPGGSGGSLRARGADASRPEGQRQRRWNQTLLPVLDKLGHDLGLPSGCTVTAELHSMLVYAPGQFFVEHLVLTKTDALFSREAQRRRRDPRDLLWLTRNRGDRAKRRPG
jgi:hypothetical protein